jgi:hypothetical protein
MLLLLQPSALGASGGAAAIAGGCAENVAATLATK